MKQKVHAAATLKAFITAFKFSHKDWSEAVQEYKVPRLFFYQAGMVLWWTSGSKDQSNELNNLCDSKHPDKKEFPPVSGKTAKVNRLTQVSKNQTNITNEILNLTVQSFSCDIDEDEIRNTRRINKVLGRRWVYFGKKANGMHMHLRDKFRSSIGLRR
jgi:hypothetical protein